MNNQSKKLHNLRESNDAIFQELFGFGKKNSQPTNNNSNKALIQQVGQNTYRLGKGVITGIQGVGVAKALSFDFLNTHLEWLIDCEYEGILRLDLDKQVLESFSGVWKKGVFKGVFFGGGSIFEGGEFGDEVSAPIYVPKFDTWKVPVMNFVSGTIFTETGGILGMQNRGNGPVNNGVNILSLPPGKSLLISLRSNIPIRSAGGKMQPSFEEVTHKINFLKRIDKVSSDIILEIVNGETKESRREEISWSQFRKYGEDSLMFTPGVQNTFTKILSSFGIDLSGKISNAEIVDYGKSNLNLATQNKESIEQKLSSTQQTFDLKKIPYLNIGKPFRGAGGKMQAAMKDVEAYFYIPTADYLNKFNEVKRNIESGKFGSDISIIASGLRNGIIKGYGKYQYLAKLFNNIEGPVEDLDTKSVGSEKNYELPLLRLSDFMQHFVDRIFEKGSNENVNQKTQDLIVNQLKGTLGVDKVLKSSKTATQPAKQPKTKAAPKMKFAESTDVRNMINNILSENLKHF